MATGLLVLGVGTATRLLGYVGGHDKTYEATIRLGAATVTHDREREVLRTVTTAGLDDAAIRALYGNSMDQIFREVFSCLVNF